MSLCSANWLESREDPPAYESLDETIHRWIEHAAGSFVDEIRCMHPWPSKKEVQGDIHEADDA